MIRSISDMDLAGQRVFIRVDYNVPIRDGVVRDETRIVGSLKTIEYAIEKGAKVILGSHMGRPKGERKDSCSLRPVFEHIKQKGYFPIEFVDDCIGREVEEAVANMKPSTVLLLENLRFHKGEESCDLDFVDSLSKFCDIVIVDAFGTCHRKHASVYGLPVHVGKSAAGFLVQKEVEYFDKLLNAPATPFAAIVGGAKINDKIGVIEHLLGYVDKLFIGGAMAYTFLKYQGFRVGKSMVEIEHLNTVEEFMEEASSKGVEVFLPVDHVASMEFCGEPEYVGERNLPDYMMGLDIGKETIQLYKDELKTCKTVLWNGPMGVFEDDRYAVGTMKIAKCLASSSATTVVGGGDSVAAVNKADLGDKISHISTGGGASLEYIEYGSLPVINMLKD